MTLASDPPRPFICGVCEGAGAWGKQSGQPIFTYPRPDNDMVQVCHFCHGTGRLERDLFGRKP